MPPRLPRTGPVPPFERLAAMRQHPSPLLGPLLRRLADDLDPALGNKTFLGLSKEIGISNVSLMRLFHDEHVDPRLCVLDKIAAHYGYFSGNHGTASAKPPRKPAATRRTSRTSRPA